MDDIAQLMSNPGKELLTVSPPAVLSTYMHIDCDHLMIFTAFPFTLNHTFWQAM